LNGTATVNIDGKPYTVNTSQGSQMYTPNLYFSSYSREVNLEEFSIIQEPELYVESTLYPQEFIEKLVGRNGYDEYSEVFAVEDTKKFGDIDVRLNRFNDTSFILEYACHGKYQPLCKLDNDEFAFRSVPLGKKNISVIPLISEILKIYSKNLAIFCVSIQIFLSMSENPWIFWVIPWT
jgi:hypothetical protein